VCARAASIGNYSAVVFTTVLLALTVSSCGDVNLQATRRSASDAGSLAGHFVDEFDTLDPATWTCEYACPKVAGGEATFSLLAGVPPEQTGSWSKIRYLPQRFTSGTFTARFALGARPKGPVWWGVALWDQGPLPDESQYSEIYFGYRTDGSLTDSQFLLESARRAKNLAVTVDAGQSLYDGAFHVGQLVFTPTRIDVYLDDRLLQSITDESVIPNEPLDFLLGTRLVTTPALDVPFDERIDRCTIDW
jgi:hypothetical protein